MWSYYTGVRTIKVAVLYMWWSYESGRTTHVVVLYKWYYYTGGRTVVPCNIQAMASIFDGIITLQGFNVSWQTVSVHSIRRYRVSIFYAEWS